MLTTLPNTVSDQNRLKKFIMVKGHFPLSLSKLKREEAELLKIVTGYGAPMHRECILKLLLPHTLNTGFGDVLQHFLCRPRLKKLT